MGGELAAGRGVLIVIVGLIKNAMSKEVLLVCEAFIKYVDVSQTAYYFSKWCECKISTHLTRFLNQYIDLANISPELTVG